MGCDRDILLVYLVKNLPILFIILISAFLRFYNLLHDSPYFFNPDERNMANAITQFRLPNDIPQIPKCLLSQFQISNFKFQISDCNLNPNFFAYGQFPLYLALFSDQLSKPIINLFYHQLPTTIFYLRIFSALSSTLTVLLIYLITKELFKNLKLFPFIGNLKLKIENLAALMAAFTPGLIQSAHFGTTESLLTFFFMASIYISILSINNSILNSKFLILNSIILGLSLGTKLTGLFFFIPPIISIIIQFLKLLKKTVNLKNRFIVTLRHCFIVALLLIGSLFFYLLSSPFNFIDYENFRSAVFGYEQDVATGRYEAFYTRQFVDTLPIFFQSEKIFPYALGWPIFILGSLGLLSLSFKLLRSTKFNSSFFILIFSFLIFLLPNALLFAKWTRFMTPILPFFSIFAAYFLFKLRTNLKLDNWIIGLLVFISMLPGAAFMTIYTRPDTRLQASQWIYQNIPNNSYILSETGNVVDIPLPLLSKDQRSKTKDYTVISFDFYHLDENPALFNSLLSHLEKADYIFVPSRRIFANYTRFPSKYPMVTKYYQLLVSEALGFEEATRINSFPRLDFGNWNLDFVDEQSEETWTVFDHPVIRIYKKTNQLSKTDYNKLFENSKIDTLKIQ